MNKKIMNLAIQILFVAVLIIGITTIIMSNREAPKGSSITVIEVCEASEAITSSEIEESKQMDIMPIAGTIREFPKKISTAENGKKSVKHSQKKEKSASPKKAAEETTEKTSQVDPDDLYILAHVIDGEGRGEDDEFKWLVGAVVLNRVKADIYPNTIKEVVFQVDKWGVQYACTKDGNYYREPQKSSWRIAEQLLKEGITEDDIPKNVTYQSANPNQGKIWKEYKCKSGLTCYFCKNKWIK